ncbi:unnamed protein product [Ilex paraguariensis]|uniref:Uncharacterized protein n=1 Tax=Ilex paraguariensis TaxID=185542 RepID=A0ABC8R682_9AQUA
MEENNCLLLFLNYGYHGPSSPVSLLFGLIRDLALTCLTKPMSFFLLQATVNRSKGNRTEFSKAELIQKSSYCRVSGRDMDLLELSAYGNVRRGQDSGGCRIQ